MPKVEIDEVELRQLHELKQLTNAMTANPKARRLLETAHKTVDPEARTPLLDHEAEVNAPLEEMRKKLAALEAERAAEKAEREKEAGLAAIRGNIDAAKQRYRSDGWTAEGIAGVEKLMDEKGILDFDIAAAAFEKLHPPPTPVAPRGSGAWNFMEEINDGEADLKKLIESKGENNPLLDKMAREALNEVRGNPRR